MPMKPPNEFYRVNRLPFPGINESAASTPIRRMFSECEINGTTDFSAEPEEKIMKLIPEKQLNTLAVRLTHHSESWDSVVNGCRLTRVRTAFDCGEMMTPQKWVRQAVSYCSCSSLHRRTSPPQWVQQWVQPQRNAAKHIELLFYNRCAFQNGRSVWKFQYVKFIDTFRVFFFCHIARAPLCRNWWLYSEFW